MQVHARGEFQAYVGTGTVYPSTDAALFSRFHSKGARNVTKVNDPKLDGMIEQQSRLGRDLEQRKKVLYGTPESLTIRYTPQHGNTRTYTTNFEGVIPNLDRRYKETGSEGIRQEMSGRGLIWVLHRASLARQFQEVLVMDRGQLVEQGTLAELDKPGTKLHELMAVE